MANIGRVIMGPTGQQRALRNQQPTYKPDIHTTLSELTDVSTNGVQDGYALVYNSTTQKYEASPITVTDVNIDKIAGGTF